MVDNNKTMIHRGVSTIAEVETAINEKAREEHVEAQDAATLDAAKAYTDEQIDTRETPGGAQDKADAAAQAAQAAAITTATAHSDTALKAHTDNAAIHKTSEQIRAEVVDADIPATLARVTDVDMKDAATLATAKTYTDTKVAALVDGAPETLDTLKEVADALKANEDGATAMMEVIGTKADAVATTAALAGKVDVELGKGLSSNDYTDAEKEKLAGLGEYALPAATASVLGGVKVGDNLTVDADGRLNASAGGGSGGGGESNVLILPWVEPVFDAANPDVPTNQQEFIDAWGSVIKKYDTDPGKYHVIMNIQVDTIPLRLDCQLVPALDILGNKIGYSISATAITPLEIRAGKMVGLRQYQSVSVLVSNGEMTAADRYLSSPMMNMETGMPNYLLDSDTSTPLSQVSATDRLLGFNEAGDPVTATAEQVKTYAAEGLATTEAMTAALAGKAPLMPESLEEQLVPGEFWLDTDGVKRQVYVRTFRGTTGAGKIISSIPRQLKVVRAEVNKDGYIIPQGVVIGQTYNTSLLFNIYIGNDGNTYIVTYESSMENKPYSVTLEYTKE